MKTTFLPLLLALSVQMLSGQALPSLEDPAFGQYFDNPGHLPIIKGKINNLSTAEMGQMQVSYTVVAPYSETNESQGHVALNADGTFEIKLRYPFPNQRVWISVDTLFFTGVYVNSEVLIELDAERIKAQNWVEFIGPGVRYLGPDGELNTYTNNHTLFQREQQLEIEDQLNRIKSAPKPNYQAFIQSFDSLYAVLHGIDQAFILQNPSRHAELIRAERQSAYFADLCAAHWIIPLPNALFEKIAAHKPAAVSNAGSNYYDHLFMLLHNATLRKRTADKIPYNMVSATQQVVALLDSLFTPNKADILKMQFSSKDLNEQKLKMETVMPRIKTAWCKQVVSDQHQITLEKLGAIREILATSKPITSGIPPGKAVAELPFGARLYQAENMSVDSFLTLLKSAFPNKALFIDFWATWCGPCIAEFPHSKKLSAESKDLPVEFVYLCSSSGSDLDKWRTKIVEHQIGGAHIFVEKKLAADLMNLFSASGFPSYVLINAKGDYMPGAIRRPSAMSRAALAELLK